MCTRARKVTPGSYGLPAIVLAFFTAGMERKGRKKICSGKDLCFPPDIFGDSHSFVVVLAWRGLSYLFLLFALWGENRGWVFSSLLSHSWLVTPALPLRSRDSMPTPLIHPLVMHTLTLPLLFFSLLKHALMHTHLPTVMEQQFEGITQPSPDICSAPITMRAWLKGQNETVSPCFHCP